MKNDLNILILLYKMFKCCEKLKNLGFKPINILDIGAHHGNWTKEIYNLFPTSKYILIEPIEYPELKQFNHVPTISVKNVILNDEEKMVDWYEMRNTGDSMFKERTHHFSNCVPSKKQSTTLDILFNTNIIVDLIKIDVQGAEINVLKGGLNLIKNTSFIILEMPFMGQYNENTPNFLEHIKFMDENGFVPYDIIDSHRSDYLLFQVDMCFINKNHKLNGIMQEKINNMGK